MSLEPQYNNILNASSFLQALSNPNRLMILCLLIQEGELTVGAINEKVDLSASALSQHLAKMRDEEIVTYRRESQTLYYRIHNPDVIKLMNTLKDIFCPETKEK